MSKYIKGLKQDNEQKWQVDLNNLRYREKKNLNAFLTLSKKYDNSEEFFYDFMYSFIRGKDMFKKPGVSLRDFWFLPSKTDDMVKDYANIIEFLQEYSILIGNKLNADLKLDDPEIEMKKENIITLQNNIYESFNESKSTRILNIYTEEKSSDSVVADLKNAKESKVVFKYDLLRTYTNALIARETRKKPHWWEFKKLIAASREKSAIKDFEKYLKSVGITEKALNNSKEYLTEVNGNDLVEKTACVYDRVNIFNHAFVKAQTLSEYEKSNRLLKEDRDELILSSLMPYYKEMKEAHESEKWNSRNGYEKEKYEEEKNLLKNFVNSVHDTFHISKNLINEQINNIKNKLDYFGRESHLGKFMEPMRATSFNHTLFINGFETGLDQTFGVKRKESGYLEKIEFEDKYIDVSDDSQLENENKNTKKKKAIIKGAKLTKAEKKKFLEERKKLEESNAKKFQPYWIADNEIDNSIEEIKSSPSSLESNNSSELENEEIESVL